jgi:drug/metabolite transporter (DMT)-like permease
MLGAAFFFSVMAALVKALPRIPAQEKVFVRSALNVAFTLALMWRYRAPLLGRERRALFLRGALGYLALSCHFYALGALPLADALVLHNASPLVVAVLAPALLGERGDRASILLAAAGFAGVAMIVRPEGRIEPLPGAIALAGGVFSALAYMTIRAIGKREHPLTVVLYFPLVSVFLSLPPTLRALVPPTPLEALALLGIGISTTVAQILLTAALRIERAAVASQVSYVGIAFGAGFGVLAFDEVPRWGTVAGAAVVIAATWAIARRSPPDER